MEIRSISTDLVAPVAPQATPSPAVQAQDREVIRAVKALSGTQMFGENNELTFVLDRETRRPLVRIVDRETKEVIRQIPPEIALRLAAELGRL